MAQSNYQEPIEKEDVDLRKKLAVPQDPNIAIRNTEQGEQPKIAIGPEIGEAGPASPEAATRKTERIPGQESEISAEAGKDEEQEKIETARKSIQTQKTASTTTIQEDAKVVSAITDFEKKIEKLVELALQRGPEHAIRIAKHMDSNDFYTMDELHDRMLEDDLRTELIKKGLLKEL